MGTPEITIVVPIFNTEAEMLRNCIKSIRKQTFSDFELILIDDGSLNEVADLCDLIAEDDNRIAVYHKRNEGVSVARNFGIDISKAPYITFIDADDWIEDNYLEILYDDITSKNYDISMCTRSFETRKNSKADNFFEINMVFDRNNKTELIKKTLTTGIGGTWCKMYNKGFLNDYGLKYDIRLRRTQDIIFNLYCFQYAEKIHYISKPLYHYRLNNTSVTHKYNKNISSILTLAANEFTIFTKKFYNDNGVMQCLYWKHVSILTEILKIDIFHKDTERRYIEKKGEIIRLCNLTPYKEAIDMLEIKKLPLSSKVKIYCLKKEVVIVLQGLFCVQNEIHRRRLY